MMPNLMPNRRGPSGPTEMDPPNWLLDFDPAHWPGADRELKFAEWDRARAQWFYLHGWPGGVAALAAGVRATRAGRAAQLPRTFAETEGWTP